MKHRFTIAMLLAICGFFYGRAQSVPQGFSYQSVVRDAAGNAHANQTVTMLFAIRSGAANGQVIYTERHVTNTNEYGLVNLSIGRGEVLGGDFATINWGGGPKYLSASVETSPNVFEELGSTELLSVPFALYSLNAANGGGGGGGGDDNWGTQVAITDETFKGNGTGGNPLGLSDQNAQVGQVLKWNGVRWIPQDDISSTGQNGGTVTQINTTNGISGGPITTSGTIGLTNTGVVPGPYGSATQIPVITVDAQGRISSVFTVVPSPGTVNIIGGTGIAVQPNGFNFTVTNTGDVNPADDLTNTSTANGDVTGVFSNLQIKADAVTSAEIAPNSVGASEIEDGSVGAAELANSAVTAPKLAQMGAATGQVLKWNGTAWAPAADQNNALNLSAGTGIAITGTAPNLTISNSGDTNAADDLTNASQAAGDVSGPFSNLQIVANAVNTPELANNAVTTPKIADNAVTTPKIADNAITTPKIADDAVTGAKIAPMNAAAGQVLKWNGNIWAPANDDASATAYQAGNGIGFFPNGNTVTITNTGDDDPSDDITNTMTANGDITGQFLNLQIKPGVVGNAELAANAVASANIIDGSVATADLALNSVTSAIIANGTIAAADLSSMGAADGQVLVWTNNAWVPTTLSGTGTGDNWGSQTVVTTPRLSGNGTTASPLELAKNGANDGQILVWKDNANAWVPSTVPAGSGDNWGTQTVATTGPLTGTGVAANPVTLATQGIANGKILKMVNGAWAPSDDLVGTGGSGNNYSAGTGISFSGTAPNLTINNSGDLSNSNELQTISLANNVITLSQGGGSVTLPAAAAYTAGNGIGIAGQTITNTGDLSSTNEIQNLALNGSTLSLSQSAATVTIDPSSTNELQSLALNGTTLRITGTNSTVKLDTILGANGLGLWQPTPTGGHIFNGNTGNVGVGTNTPIVKFHVKGDGQSVRLEGNNPMLALTNSPTGVDGYVWMRSTAVLLGTRDSSNVILQTAQENKGLIQNGITSNVGIGGFNTGAHKLKVMHEDYGFLLENVNNNNNWEFYVSDNGGLALYNNTLGGNVPAGVFATNGVYTPSDRRLKKDIATVPSVLSKLTALKPVTYRYNKETNDAPLSMGFIAQDVQQVFPELVGTSPVRDGQGGTLMVNYGGISVVAIKAIQEQQVQIDQLSKENAYLRARLDAIEAILNAKK